MDASKMEKLISKCCQERNIKYNIIDMLLLRSYKTKLQNHCHYFCSITEGINHIKFNGRYPFKEFLYCTEFASVLFSILNLLVHIYCYNTYIKENIDKCKIGRLYKAQYYIFCSCWIFSALFHTNDIKITRYGDYFTAFLFLLFALYLNIMRCQLLINIKIWKSLKYYFGIYFVMHVFYMAFIDFNYTYSKIACIIMLTSSIILWNFQYCMLRKNNWAKYIVFYYVLLIFGALFEIYDMPPVFYLFDSHSIWHLITALIAPLYYLYSKNDMLHKSNLSVKPIYNKKII